MMVLISLRIMEGWWWWWVAPFNFIINQNPNAWIPRLEILDLYFRLDNTNVSDSKYIQAVPPVQV